MGMLVVLPVAAAAIHKRIGTHTLITYIRTHTLNGYSRTKFYPAEEGLPPANSAAETTVVANAVGAMAFVAGVRAPFLTRQ